MASAKSYPFSSVQLDFPTEQRDYFISKTKGLIRRDWLYQPNTGRYGLEERPHVTVLYGLHDETPSLELINLFETYPKFSATLGKITLFRGDENGNDFDVVKADVDCSDLHVLNSEIAELCEYTNDHPEYKPHATVGYVEKGIGNDLEGSRAVYGLSIPVQQVVFSGKNGTKRLINLGLR
jgi:2'-5' RNA ligase